MGDDWKVPKWNTVSKMLTRVPVRPHNVRPPIVLNDGCIFAIQAREASLCSPKKSYGPWKSFEVTTPDRWIARLMPYLMPNEDPMAGPYAHVPVHVLEAIIAEGHGVAGYLWEDEIVPLGDVRKGLMLLQKPPMSSVQIHGGADNMHWFVQWGGPSPGKACYATLEQAKAAMQEMLDATGNV